MLESYIVVYGTSRRLSDKPTDVGCRPSAYECNRRPFGPSLALCLRQGPALDLAGGRAPLHSQSAVSLNGQRRKDAQKYDTKETGPQTEAHIRKAHS